MPEDPSGKAIRHERDRILDSLYKAMRPLDLFPNQRPQAEMDRAPLPEIVYYPAEDGQPATTVVVATFRDFDVVLSESRRTIYTEQHLVAERVIAAGQPVTVGQTLIGIEPGGTARIGEHVIEYETQPRPEVLIPLHRYVLFLQSLPSADCYWVNKAWELTDGPVEPVQVEDIERARQHISVYAGMGEIEFLGAVQRAVDEQIARAEAKK